MTNVKAKSSDHGATVWVATMEDASSRPWIIGVYDSYQAAAAGIQKVLELEDGPDSHFVRYGVTYEYVMGLIHVAGSCLAPDPDNGSTEGPYREFGPHGDGVSLYGVMIAEYAILDRKIGIKQTYDSPVTPPE